MNAGPSTFRDVGEPRNDARTRRAQCTLAGKFSPEPRTSDWAEAHRIAEAYETVDSWTFEKQIIADADSRGYVMLIT